MSQLHTLEERTYLVSDKSKVADKKYKGPMHLLGAAGQKIPMAQAIELGLADEPEKPAAKKVEPKP